MHQFNLQVGTVKQEASCVARTFLHRDILYFWYIEKNKKNVDGSKSWTWCKVWETSSHWRDGFNTCRKGLAFIGVQKKNTILSTYLYEQVNIICSKFCSLTLYSHFCPLKLDRRDRQQEATPPWLLYAMNFVIGWFVEVAFLADHLGVPQGCVLGPDVITDSVLI